MRLTLPILLVSAAIGAAAHASGPGPDPLYSSDPWEAFAERTTDRVLNLWDRMTSLLDDLTSSAADYNPLGGYYGPATQEDKRREVAFRAIVRAAGYTELEQLVGYGAYPERQIHYAIARQPSDSDLEAVERRIRRFKQQYRGPMAWVDGVVLNLLLNLAHHTEHALIDSVIVTLLPIPHVEVVVRGDGDGPRKRRRRSLADTDHDQRH